MSKLVRTDRTEVRVQDPVRVLEYDDEDTTMPILAELKVAGTSIKTWLTAEQAVALGFLEEVTNIEPGDTYRTERGDLIKVHSILEHLDTRYIAYFYHGKSSKLYTRTESEFLKRYKVGTTESEFLELIQVGES